MLILNSLNLICVVAGLSDDIPFLHGLGSSMLRNSTVLHEVIVLRSYWLQSTSTSIEPITMDYVETCHSAIAYSSWHATEVIANTWE